MTDDIRNSRELLGIDVERESIARSLVQELRYQRANLQDILDVKQRINGFDKILLDLHRKVEESASKLNDSYGTTQSIAKQLIKDEQTLTKLRREAAFHSKNLSTTIKDNSLEIEAQKEVINDVAKQWDLAREEYQIYQDSVRAGVVYSAQEVSAANKKIAAASQEYQIQSRILASLESEQKTEAERVALISTQYGKVQEISAALQILLDKGDSLTEIEKSHSLLLEEQLSQRIDEINMLSKGLSADAQRAVAANVLLIQQEKIVEERKKEQEVLKNINKTLGLTGAAIGGFSTIANRLGMGHISDDLKDIQDKLNKDVADAVKANGGKALDWGKKLDIMAKGMGESIKVFAVGLTDPLFILTKIFAAFLKVNDASVKLQRLTGQNTVTQAGFNDKMIDTVDYLTTAVELTEKLGFNAQNAFSTENIGGAAELKNLLGLAADEAAGLALIAQSSGKNVDNIAKGVVDTVSAFNKANRSAVSQGVVLKDIAKVSDNIKVSLGNNPKALAEAASAARRLGMELSQVDKIADSLMDFETSIQNQLEAQLLTGKNIDLAKARELALNNDLAGLGKELFKNSADILEYGKMNRIQQEAYAKSLGMTKDDLAKIAYNRAIEAKMTDEQAAAAAGVTLEEMKRMQVQESLQKSLTKLAQAFAPLLEIVVLIVKPITWILNLVSKIIAAVSVGIDWLAAWVGGPAGLNKIWSVSSVIRDVLGAIVGLLFLKLIPGTGKWFGMLKGIPGALKGIPGALKGIPGALKGIPGALKGLGSKIGGFFSRNGAPTPPPPPAPPVPPVPPTVTGPAANLKAKAGQGIKDFLRNLASGLKAMGQPGVGKGAINLIPASVGLVVMIPGVLGAKAIEQINGPALKKALVGLATGLQAMSGTFLGSLALGAASIGLIAMIPGVLGAKAIEQLNGPALKKGLTGLASGLKAFGKAVADPLFWLAIAGLGSLALVAMGFGKALSYVSPLIEALGKIIIGALKEVPSIIGAVADGFVKIMGAVTLGNVGGLLLLGPALVSASVGMLAFSAALAAASVGNSITKLFTGEGILKPLKELTAMADSLSSVSSSLTSIASAIMVLSASLADLNIEKIKALADTKFGSLQGVSTTSITPIQTKPLEMAEGGIATSQVNNVTVGEAGKEAIVPLTEFYAKMDELISVVKKGGNVYLDGNKVGYNLMLGSTKLS